MSIVLSVLNRSDKYLTYLSFSPLTYNGEVTKLTWPEVTDIKNPRYTNCRYLCPYCTPRVSKSSDQRCVFGTMSNFEKRNLRSGHFWRPGHATFGVIGSSFFRKVRNCWLNSHAKFGGAAHRRFFAIHEKPEGGGRITAPPPAVRRLIAKVLSYSVKMFCRCRTLCPMMKSAWWLIGVNSILLITELTDQRR